MNNGYRLAPLCTWCLRNSVIQHFEAQASIILPAGSSDFHCQHEQHTLPSSSPVCLLAPDGMWLVFVVRIFIYLLFFKMCVFTCAYVPCFARKGPVFFFPSHHGKNHRRKPQGLSPNKKEKGGGIFKGANISLPRKKRKERERKSFNRDQHVR